MLGMDVGDLARLLPRLNSLGKAFLAERASGNGATSRAPKVSDLRALGLKWSDWRDLLDRGLVQAQANRRAAHRILLTEAGLAVLQATIPLGAIRPVYDSAVHRLTVAGCLILEPAVQGRNLSAVLTSLEVAGWAPRVEKPLAGRRCANDPHSLRAATSTLSKKQRVIELHAHDGAVTWNWRPERSA